MFPRNDVIGELFLISILIFVARLNCDDSATTGSELQLEPWIQWVSFTLKSTTAEAKFEIRRPHLEFGEWRDVRANLEGSKFESGKAFSFGARGESTDTHGTTGGFDVVHEGRTVAKVIFDSPTFGSNVFQLLPLSINDGVTCYSDTPWHTGGPLGHIDIVCFKFTKIV